MSPGGRIRVPVDEAQAIAEAALAAHGASNGHATSTGRSVVAAQAEGNETVGFSHLLDYCEALQSRRVDGAAEPMARRASESVFRIDARAGFPHLGVDTAWAELTAVTARQGVAVLSLKNGYTCGALGYFARRLADDHGLAGLVAANAGPAVMPAAGGRSKVFCTNPLAFAMPNGDGESVVIDQSSAYGSLVGIRKAAVEGSLIPEGWALDARGNPTTDPADALSGSLASFGGYRGANIALLVELLAAGLTGANWSYRAPPFNAGSASPGVGLLIVAIAPDLTNGPHSGTHTRALLDFISADAGAYVPGPRKRRCAADARQHGVLVDAELWKRVLDLSPANRR